MYKDKEYTECTEVDAASPWCATGTTRNKAAIHNMWQFCHGGASTLSGMDNGGCNSRETLDLLIDEFLDLSKTTPKVIAEELFKIGCPFSCHYQKYSAKLLMKKHDTTMAPDHLRLTFEWSQETSMVENLKKDLDYTLDMFISDVGNGFGFLLGLSLIGIIRIFLSSVRSFVEMVKSPKTLSKALIVSYVTLKWAVVGCFITFFTIGSVSLDFEDLLPFQQLPDTESISSLLDTKVNSGNVDWGFSKNLSGQSDSCQFDVEIADGFCDDKVNIEECSYDGGDCCRLGAELKPNGHLFCTNCLCHSGSEGSENRVLKPGVTYLSMVMYYDL